jgi:hypothetical protein
MQKPCHDLQGTKLTHGSFMDVRSLNAQTEGSDPQRHLEEFQAINEVNVAFQMC